VYTAVLSAAPTESVSVINGLIEISVIIHKLLIEQIQMDGAELKEVIDRVSNLQNALTTVNASVLLSIAFLALCRSFDNITIRD